MIYDVSVFRAALSNLNRCVVQDALDFIVPISYEVMTAGTG